MTLQRSRTETEKNQRGLRNIRWAHLLVVALLVPLINQVLDPCALPLPFHNLDRPVVGSITLVAEVSGGDHRMAH
jgi:hypothetical protein